MKNHIMTNNYEHFCAWCLDCEGRSRQVDRWFARPRAAALAIAAWLANELTAFRIFQLAFQKSPSVS